MPISPYTARHKFTDNGDNLTIIIPSRKNGWIIGFSILWLISDISGIYTTYFSPASQYYKQLPIIFYGLSVITTLAAFFIALYVFLWQLFGKEIIKVNTSAIFYKHGIFAIGRNREYTGRHIKSLRVNRKQFSKEQLRWKNWTWIFLLLGLKGGPICFDYGARTIRIGGSIDEAEAGMITKEITARYAQYGRGMK